MKSPYFAVHVRDQTSVQNFDVPLRNRIIFWSAAEIITRTTLIADDKSRRQRRIWVLRRCQGGSSWRNKAAFCFSSKSLLSLIRKKKHFNASPELVCNLIRFFFLKMQLFFWEDLCLYVVCKEWYRKHSSFCFNSSQWSDSHAAFVMASLTGRTALYPIQNRPSFLLPWPVVTFLH